MKKAIYKYENKINHKIYIGQSNNPERRFEEHRRGHSKQNSLLEKAIAKYGLENFNFEIIEWTEDHDNREEYWIQHYNSRVPYGYNICVGGGFLPNQQKDSHSQASISEEKARSIQRDLMDFNIPQRQIIKKYQTTYKVVESIKIGHTWDYYNLSYPLRPHEEELDKIRALKVIKLLKETQLSFAEIAKQVGWGKSQISMINLGKNHPQKNETYPIRKEPTNYEDKVAECIELLKQNKTNGEIAKILNTSTAWVSRINCGKTHINPELKYPIRK